MDHEEYNRTGAATPVMLGIANNVFHVCIVVFGLSTAYLLYGVFFGLGDFASWDRARQITMMGNINSFNFEVGMRCFLLSKTFTLVSKALINRCLLMVETNKIGTSVNGWICSRICTSKSRVLLVSFSTKSHLFTNITIPFRFFSANQKIL